MEELIEMFKGGAAICIWRNSTPHNIWIETDGCEIELDGQQFQKLKSIANFHDVSNAVVTYGTFMLKRSDSGQPIMECYFYNKPTEKQLSRVKLA